MSGTNEEELKQAISILKKVSSSYHGWKFDFDLPGVDGKNCNTKDPEEVKFYISKKQCSNAHKENLIEAYAIVIKSLSLTCARLFC